jgi:hypothetical protein
MLHVEQGFNPFLPYGGFLPLQPTPQQMAQAMMQQQAAAAIFGPGQPSMPNFAGGQPEQMRSALGLDPAMAMRSMHFVQAMAANAAMMGFQV